MKIHGSGNLPYSERRKQAVVKALPRLTLTAVDGYVASATAFPGLKYGSAETLGQFRVMSGILGAVHGISAIVQLNRETDGLAEKRAAQTMVTGELITAAGFVGLAAGMGTWALPLIAIGEITTNFARFS